MNDVETGVPVPQNGTEYEDSFITPDWGVVCQLFRFSNIGRDQETLLQEFLTRHEQTENSVVLVATHSWGGREWKGDRENVLFFEDRDFDGGWHVLTENDATYIKFTSFSSGSWISAEKDEHRWVINLSTPMHDGAPYKGAYWEAFYAHTPLPRPPPTE